MMESCAAGAAIREMNENTRSAVGAAREEAMLRVVEVSQVAVVASL